MAKKKDSIEEFVDNVKETAEDILNTPDETDKFKKKDIKTNKGMAMLAYIFVPIPLIFERESEFVKFHINQGLNLFIAFIAYSVIYGLLSKITLVEQMCTINGLEFHCGRYEVPWFVELPFLLIGLCIIIAIIYGIVNVINGKAKQIPIIGKFNLIK
ncbi:MAG: DUF4870 domain-containing protein [Bacilli bacterium]|nr:DUF4870 domain-containing protein [Bacilli bacterium]